MFAGDSASRERFEAAQNVGDVFAEIVTKPAVVREDAVLRDAVAAILSSETTRKAYVVDAEGRLKGTIGIETLMRLVSYRIGARPPGVVSFVRFLRDMQSEDVGRVMDRPKPVTRETAIADLVRMVVEEHLNDFPVVDGQGILVGEVNTQHLLAATRALFDLPTEG